MLVIGVLMIVSKVARSLPGDQTLWEFFREAVPSTDTFETRAQIGNIDFKEFSRKGAVMKSVQIVARRVVVLLFAVIVVACASSASAQEAGAIEIGSSLVNLTVLSPEHGNTQTLFGVPPGTFGILSPGVYASFFASSRVAVEPQLGLLVAHSDNATNHVLNFAGQIDYFINEAASSPYLFAGAGVIDVSGESTHPKTVDLGVGYRWRIGLRLTFRLDGRYMHVTDNGGNGVGFTLSIGGLMKE